MDPTEKALKFQEVIRDNDYRGVVLVLAHVLASGVTDEHKVLIADLFVRAAWDLLANGNADAFAEFFDVLPTVGAKNLVLAGTRMILDERMAMATVHLDTVTATVAKHQSDKDDLADEA